jgi:hypothetical protein
MTVSSDGSRLFAADDTNYEIVSVDLDASKVGSKWRTSTSTAAILAYSRTNGEKLVLAGNGGIYDAGSGRRFPVTFDAGYYGSSMIAVSKNGSRFCLLDGGISPYTLSCHALAYQDEGDAVVIGPGKRDGFGTEVGSNGQDVAMNADGTRVYVASGAPYHFTVYDAATTESTMPVVQTLDGTAYPNNVEVAFDDRIVAGASVWYGPKDVWVYSPSGILAQDFYVSGYAHAILMRQLKVSGDALRLLVLTDDPTFQILTAPS